MHPGSPGQEDWSQYELVWGSCSVRQNCILMRPFRENPPITILCLYIWLKSSELWEETCTVENGCVYINQNRQSWSWRDDSRVKSTFCSFQGLGLSSTTTRLLKLSVTPVPGNLTPCSCLCRHQAFMQCIYIPAGKTLIHIKWINIKIESYSHYSPLMTKFLLLHLEQ